jgi:hypothetical protein
MALWNFIGLVVTRQTAVIQKLFHDQIISNN